MIFDFRLNILFKNIVKRISNNKNIKYEDWINRYNELPDNFKENLVVSIYKFQSKDIREQCKLKEESYLINLGVFKIKASRRIALDIKNKLINEAGYKGWNDLPENKRYEILEKTESLKREKLIERNNSKDLIKEGNKTKVIYLSTLKPVKKL